METLYISGEHEKLLPSTYFTLFYVSYCIPLDIINMVI